MFLKDNGLNINLLKVLKEKNGDNFTITMCMMITMVGQQLHYVKVNGIKECVKVV